MADNDFFETLGSESDSSFPGGPSLDDLDAFLADLKLDSPTEFQKEPASPEAESSKPPKKGKKPRKSPSEKPAAPPQEPPRGVGGFIMRHHRGVNLVLLLICLALAAGIAAVILVQTNQDPLGGKIMENVFIAGVDVGGMSKEQATAAVNTAIGNNFAEETMVVELGSGELTLPASQVRPGLDVRAAVNAAFSLGRTGSVAQRQKDYRKAQIAPIELPLAQYLTMDTDYIRNTVSQYLHSVTGEYTPSSYYLEGDSPALDGVNFDAAVPCQSLVLELGVPGRQVDLDGICEAIWEGYSRNTFHIVIPRTLLAQFPEKLDIDAIYQELHADPVDAREEAGKIIPGSCGYTFDLEAARAQLNAADFGQVLSIPMEYVMPQDLEGNGSFTQVVGVYASPVSSNEAYNQNMALLCQKLDGLILKPGQSFSFNQFMGDFSEASGYQKAPRHGDCCADEVVCGGMDQVATTLYVAARFADLAIPEKHQGDHLCTYAPKGTELNVGSNWLDLKLSNPLKFPVKIRARVSNTKVIIQVLSEEAPGFYVKLETRDGYSIPHGTNFVLRKASNGFTNGQVLIEGVDGGQVTLHWIKYDSSTGKELSRVTESLDSRAMNTVRVSLSR